MAQFAYQAMDAAGRKIAGVEESTTREAAIDRLASRQLFVTRIEPAATVRKRTLRQQIAILPPVSAGDLVLFYRRLSTLLSSGIPLLESLDAIARQTSDADFLAILEQVRDDVRGGRSFSEALAKHPRVFPELMVSMTKVGESGGILSQVLEQVADFTQRDNEVKTEVMTALAYPVIVLLVATTTVIILLTTVIPRLMVLFEGKEATLPLPTRILMALSSGFTHYGWVLFVVLILGLLGMVRYRRTARGRESMDRLKLRLPLFGSLATKATIARFARSLSALLHGGVPLMEGLDVVDRVLGNLVLTQAVERAKERVRRGESLGRGLKDEALFPDMVKYMITAGEDSGKLDEMLAKVADIYELETRQAIKLMIGLMAPLMILGLAVLVGFIAMAMLLPIAQLNQSLG